MDDIRKSISTLKELISCTDLDKVRKLKREFEDLNLEQDMEKRGMLSLNQLIEHTKDLVNEVEGLSTYGKFPKRIDLDVCKDTRGDIFPTSKLFGETTAMINMEKIYDFINGDVRKIGVYGMGGIGKTTVMKHIYNRILEGKNDKFDCLIWVTVSKEPSIFNLQHDIACKIDVNLSNYEDPTTRARELFKVLKQKGRYLLILDDLWEGYPLEDVGIPDPDYPTSSNLCKLVLTTRSLDVCRSMKCKAIKMDLLSEDEAWNLFLHHVGHDVLQVKDLEPIARGVASECACLPLAIATVGRSMAGKKEAYEWRDALAKLRAFSKEPGDMGRRVIEQLKFSFDRLENKKFQMCLSYCALYPEDYEIEREELVELLALEGIIEEKESKRGEIDECNAILNKLKNQCLLESGKNFKGSSFVKMHDLVRDMILQMNNLHSQYLAISDTKMKKLSDVKWPMDLLKIHISNCYSLNASLMCPRLTTFILCNSSLPNIPDSFFQHFEALKVLKLSFCKSLEALPNSISNMVNLVGLFLTHCERLRYVATLAKLKNLRSLEISFTSMRYLPKGLKELSNLRYLNFYSTPIEGLSPKIITRLSQLRYLVFGNFTKGSALMGLKNLEVLYGNFGDIHELRAFVKHREQEGSPLIRYNIKVCSHVICLSFDWVREWDSFNKLVKLGDCTLCLPSEENDLYLLPKDIQMLTMERIHDFTSLCAIASLNYTRDLWFCRIASCKGVRELVTSSSSSFALQSLRTLQLYNLENLEALIGRTKALCNVFPCLQVLEICGCQRIKVLFNVGLLSNLKNLEKLEVAECCKLEEIIGESLDDEKDLNEDMTCVTLPKLRYLSLFDLPNLKSICPPTRRLNCKSLKQIHIQDCCQLLQLVNLENLEALIGRTKAPCNVFPCLQELDIFDCQRIKVLFNVGLLSNLKNLEKLEVTMCWQLKEIIGESLDTEKDLNEDTTCVTLPVTLPKLRCLSLFGLPNLKSICPPTRRLICKSLKEIFIKDCPKLEQRVYAALEDSGEPSQPPSLQPIELKLYRNRNDNRTEVKRVQKYQLAAQRVMQRQQNMRWQKTNCENREDLIKLMDTFFFPAEGEIPVGSTFYHLTNPFR